MIQPFWVLDGVETRIVVDVDLERSLKKQGGAAPIIDEPSYRLIPMIGKTTTEQVDGQQSGGEVHEPCETATVA